MDLNKALLDPSSVFSHPREVLEKRGLSRQEKIEVLRRWEYDERDLEVAAEENMAGGPPSLLADILEALHRLDAGVDCERSPPTKQGGV